MRLNGSMSDPSRFSPPVPNLTPRGDGAGVHAWVCPGLAGVDAPGHLQSMVMETVVGASSYGEITTTPDGEHCVRLISETSRQPVGFLISGYKTQESAIAAGDAMLAALAVGRMPYGFRRHLARSSVGVASESAVAGTDVRAVQAPD